MNHRPALALAAAFFYATAALHAQTAAAAPAPEEAPAVHSKTLWGQIKQGGWVMVPIGLCSVLTLYLIGDGVIRTGMKRVLPKAHVDGVKKAFRHGDYVGAFKFCRANPSPFTNVCGVAVSLLGEGKQAVEEGVIGELSKENSHMNTYISYLSVIGVCTPMIGLLGTVTGMITAFSVLGSQGIGDPSKLSEAIGEVLVATASGLVIAIPAFIGYYVLRNRAVGAIHSIQDTMAMLFRKMPYDQFAGAHIGGEDVYAAAPNWLSNEAREETTHA